MKKLKPNLVFVFADQMRGIDMGCAGNNQVITPNLDSFAKEGFMFRNAVSCFPVCTPYRACMISGRYPTTIDVMNNDIALPIDGKGFGHVLKASGYRTGWVGKWHLFGPGVRTTFIPPGEHRHGFDDMWAGVNCSHTYFDSFYYKDNDPVKVYFKGYEPDIQTDLAMEYISKYRDEPFAVFLSWGPPHDPYQQVPEQWKMRYDENEIEFRSNVDSDSKFIIDMLPGNMTIPHFDLRSLYNPYFSKYNADGKGKDLREFPNKSVLRDYYAAITALDYNFGRLMEHLKNLALEDNTIVVFTSDHGDMMYSQRAIQKNYPWEESLNVPFILRYPAVVNSGGITAKPFNTVDIMPTILELMGIRVPDFAEGCSFAPLLAGRKQKLPEAAYIMCSWPWIIPEWRGVRTERYTYVVGPEKPILLYDNKRDPFQLQNVIERQDYRTERGNLDDIYRQLARDTGDTFETWDVINSRMGTRCIEWHEKYKSSLGLK